MEKWRAAQNIRPGHEWDKFEGLSQDAGGARSVPRRGAVQPRRPPPADRARRSRCRAQLAFKPAGADVDPAGLWPGARTSSRAATASSPRASSPPRPTSPSRPISAPGSTGAACSRKAENHDLFRQREDSFDLQLGLFAEGTASRARHRRDEPVHHALGARACRTRSMASGCCRSARSTIPSSSAASMR